MAEATALPVRIGHRRLTAYSVNRRSTFRVTVATLLAYPCAESDPHQTIEPTDKTAPPFGYSR